MVNLKGGGWTAPIVRFLVDRGVPVCAHLGFTPQSVHALGGLSRAGRDEAAAATLRRHAAELAASGAELLVLEMVPAAARARPDEIAADTGHAASAPSACTDWGVKPRWAQTGTPRSTKKRTIGAVQPPPSSLTICAPCCINRVALRIAASADC